ncbi:hypothetical protein F5883DRAFT_566871, partial [Diaporthe sp. PMI_573]
IRLAAAAAEKKRLAAAGESKGDENAEPANKGDENPKLETEFLCGTDDWENHCDVVLDAVLEECENALLTKLGDKDDLTDDGSDSDSDVAMEEEKEDLSDSSNCYSSGPEPREPVDPAFDNGYFWRSDDDDTKTDPRSYKYQMRVEKGQAKLERERFDKEVKANDEDLYPKLLKQLGDVDAGREPRTLESMVKPKKKKKEKKYNSDGDTESDDNSSPTETVPEWEAGADLFDFPMLRPKALQHVINFFRSNPHVRRKDCEDFCRRIYSSDDEADPYKTSWYKNGPSEVGPDWKWPSGPGFQRPPGVLAYPSQFQFDDDVYMVQVEGEIEEGSGLPKPTDIGMMTLFYFTFEELDIENQLESAREVYGEYVPHYEWVGHMGLPAEHRQLFVWRIDCPAGQPFSTDASYFGLRMNRQMYASILRDLVDLVAAPLALLGSEGEQGEGEEINVQQLLQAWPMALHNPRIDADNIIVGSDYKSMVGLLRWTTPSVVTLPLGASLLGLLCLEGTPLQEPGDIELPWWSRNRDYTAAFHQRPVRRNVDPFPFETHSRNAYDLERLMLLYVQAKVPALAQHPEIKELWEHLFSAMRQAVDAADYMADGDKASYREQIGRMEWDWFRFPENQKKDAQGDDEEAYEADVENEIEKMEIDE